MKTNETACQPMNGTIKRPQLCDESRKPPSGKRAVKQSEGNEKSLLKNSRDKGPITRSQAKSTAATNLSTLPQNDLLSHADHSVLNVRDEGSAKRRKEIVISSGGNREGLGGPQHLLNNSQSSIRIISQLEKSADCSGGLDEDRPVSNKMKQAIDFFGAEFEHELTPGEPNSKQPRISASLSREESCDEASTHESSDAQDDMENTINSSRLECKRCKKELKSQSGLTVHERFCKGSREKAKQITIAELKSILSGINGNEVEWPRNLRRKALENSDARLPRGSWSIITKFYNQLFSKKSQVEDIQRLASVKKATAKYQPLSPQSIDGRIRSLHQEENMSYLKNEMITNYALLGAKRIEDFETTSRFRIQQVPKYVWEVLNKAAQQILDGENRASLEAIAKTIQAAQKTVHNYLRKRRDEQLLKMRYNTSKLGSLEPLEEAKRALNQLHDLCEGNHCNRLFGNSVSPNDYPQFQLALAYILRNFSDVDSKHSRFQAYERCKVEVEALERKFESKQRRKEFAIENARFETNRSKFYRDLKQSTRKTTSDDVKDKARRFWSNMWEEDKSLTSQDHSQSSIDVVDQPDAEPRVFPNYEEFCNTITKLDNWKAPGPDRIYNVFIKKLHATHKYLYKAIIDIVSCKEEAESWFYSGCTYLIPKKELPSEGSDFRPITCLSNLYKLTTKLLTNVLQSIITNNSLLETNQLGAIRQTQGAKELAALNKAMNNLSPSKMKVAWLDASKAYDSVNHSAIIESLQSEQIPQWMKSFIKSAMSKWSIKIMIDGKSLIDDKRVSRGIMQGDSLSPLLFCLAINRVSKALNNSCSKVSIPFDSNRFFQTNHMLYMDDLKLFANTDEDLESLLNLARQELLKVGLSLNHKKSATNTQLNESFIEVIQDSTTYKYLGFEENSEGEFTDKSLQRIEDELLHRITLLLDTKLNAVNLFSAINEWAISLIDYPLGVLEFNDEWGKKLDSKVRKLLSRSSVFIEGAAIERLYLPRKELGRGLRNIQHAIDSTLMNFWKYLTSASNNPNQHARKALITKNESHMNSTLSKCSRNCLIKYSSNEPAEIKHKQKASLIDSWRGKPLHGIARKNFEKQSFNKLCSSFWLSKGNISPKQEGSLMLLQDRNLFWINKQRCKSCDAPANVDHLASRCSKLVTHEYRRRHDEIVKCIGLKIARNYMLTKAKGVGKFAIGDILDNSKAKLFYDKRIDVRTQCKHNRPDLLLIDKRANTGFIVEIGISSTHEYDRVENEKFRKYTMLSDLLEVQHKLKQVKIIPLVFTWEGFVSKACSKALEAIGMSRRETAYLLSRVLKRTEQLVTAGSKSVLEECHQPTEKSP